MKKYRLYVHLIGEYNKRKCVLVGDNYDYMVANMRDTVERFYWKYVERSAVPVLEFTLVEIYNNGSEKVLQGGNIMPWGYKMEDRSVLRYN